MSIFTLVITDSIVSLRGKGYTVADFRMDFIVTERIITVREYIVKEMEILCYFPMNVIVMMMGYIVFAIWILC